MKVNFLFGLTLSVATGCSSSYYVANEPAPDKYSLAQVNETAKDQSFTISTIHGEEIDATDLFVTGDSTSFLEPSFASTENRSAIPTSSVETITIKDAGAGAVDGLVWGAIVGAAGGLLLGTLAVIAYGLPATEDWVEVTGWVAGTAVVGGGVGAGVGALIRHSDEYIFQSQSNSSQEHK